MMKDMTAGEPRKVLWYFSIPLLLSVAFQQLYSIVDSVIAGRFVGVDALAAVGASYPVTMIYIAVATGANIGGSVIISQYFGAKDYAHVKTAVYTALTGIAGLGVLLTAVGTLACEFFIRMLNTPENVFADSVTYLNIYTWGLLFLFLYNICTGVFTALGDSRTPLYFLIASSLGNIVMDLIFVISLKMGVAGVAWATFLCQGIAALLAWFTLRRRLTGIDTRGKEVQIFSGRMLWRITRVAFPSILQQSFISIGNLLIQRLVNGYGSEVMAAYSSAVKLNTFFLTCMNALGSGVSSFTAQNMGAGKHERVSQGLRAAIQMEVLICIPFMASFLLFSPQLIQLFLSSGSDTADVVREGTLFLRIISPFYLLVGCKIMIDCLLRGAGAMITFTISTFVDLIIRVILTHVLSLRIGMGSLGIWSAWPVGWVLGMFLSLVFYRSGVWKKTSLTGV